MNLYYYKGTKPNFGDELNLLIWPKLLPEILTSEDKTIFLGVGSILFNSFPSESKKIVFGAGYGGYTPIPNIDEKWKIYFVRGKLTANLMGIDPALAIGDSAILLRSLIKQYPSKCHKVSFMPHWESTEDGMWEKVCKLAAINYIDPTKSVAYVLDQLLKSELLITEAMHGAIAADALRTPWIAVTPVQKRHQMKWYDWASALDLTLQPQHLVPSTMVEKAIQICSSKEYIICRIRKNREKINKILPTYFIEKAAERLRIISEGLQSLSNDNVIKIAHSKMLDKIQLLRADLYQ